MRNFIQQILQRVWRPEKTKKGRALLLSNLKAAQIIQKMEELMRLRRPFLKSRYSIQNLAVELGVPAYQLSYLINRKMGLNFNDYMNRYRVQYCQQLMHNGAAGNLNLKGLANNCGFQNRNTFTNAFKKFTGQTPSFYAKNHGNSPDEPSRYVLFSNGSGNLPHNREMFTN